MAAAFHYLVKAKLIRFIDNREIDFIQLNEKFVNINPIEAREQAFNYYQNYIDVLLEAKGRRYQSDKDARENLDSFIDPGTITKKLYKEVELELSDSFGNGIGVYMVIDQTIPDEIFDDKVGDEHLIHGIGHIGYGYQGFMDGLSHEFCYYEHFKYDVKNYKQIIDFYEYDVDVTEAIEILKTPVDWTG